MYEREAVSESVEESMMRQMNHQEVQKWLSTLPERDRQMLLLRYSGYSYAEIAEELNIRQPLVGSVLQRATRKLQATVAKAMTQQD